MAVTHLESETPSRPRTGGSLGLIPATALVMGTIIGVGIFNLPASFAAYGPISLIAMALATVGAVVLAVRMTASSSTVDR